MPNINFRGKEFVLNHHLSVPFSPLIEDSELGVNPQSDLGESNLIIQGDNLLALKSLLQTHEGRIDCVLIDPPYNTGQEGWCYNDNVNSPMIQEWLESNPIGIEDGLRHDKWCAMMYPRLRLLHRLMADDGIFIMHIDENELHNAILLIQEIFGMDSEDPSRSNLVGTIVWDKLNPKGDSRGISYRHESIIIAAKCRTRMLESKPMSRLKDAAYLILAKAEELMEKIGTNSAPSDLTQIVEEYSLPIDLEEYQVDWNIQRVSSEFEYWIRNNDKIPSGISAYDSISTEGEVYQSVHMGWPNISPSPDNYNYQIQHPLTGKPCPQPQRGWRMPIATLENMLGDDDPVIEPNGDVRAGEILFGPDETRQPRRRYLLHEQTYENIPSIIAFGGSDGKYLDSIDVQFDYPKPHRFIAQLISYFTNSSDTVLDSFAGSGTTGHATLLANSVDEGTRKFILVEIEEYARNLTARRLRIAIDGDDDNPALDGNFRFFTLGQALDAEELLSGEHLPTFAELGTLLFHTVTNQVVIPEEINEEEFYLGETNSCHVWMIYQNNLDWLKSSEAALTLARAREFSEKDQEKRHLVIAPALFVSKKMLDENNISVEFVPLPYTLFTV